MTLISINSKQIFIAGTLPAFAPTNKTAWRVKKQLLEAFGGRTYVNLMINVRLATG